MSEMTINFSHVYHARFLVEAATPLALGSGERGLHVDRLVATDAYGLPYLPGTSLAGVVRHALEGQLDVDVMNQLFGFQNRTEGQGSRILFTAGHLVGPGGNVYGEGGTLPVDDPFLQQVQTRPLPERDHVRINHRGVADAEGYGKFDEQVVPRGARFCFELWLEGGSGDADHWQQLIAIFSQPFFRIGGGTRKGFGKIDIKGLKTRTFDLTDATDLEAYLDTPSVLRAPAVTATNESDTATAHQDWTHYQITLKPKDYFLFGAGYNTHEVNQQPKREWVIHWDGDRPRIDHARRPYLIPATSVKGALSHRTAFHYNRLTGRNIENCRPEAPSLDTQAVAKELWEAQLATLPHVPEFDDTTEDTAAIQARVDELKAAIGRIEALELDEKSITEHKDYKGYVAERQAYTSQRVYPHTGERNAAVRALFGYAVEREEEQSQQRGRVILSDSYLEKVTPKIFSHVMIDRYTGGALQGALFNEEVTATQKQLRLSIYVNETAFADHDYNDAAISGSHVRQAFECALNDLCTGRLALGGNVAKGHGTFSGTYEKTNP